MHQPSKLTLKSGRVIELQLTVPCFTLRLHGADGTCAGTIMVKACELERVMFDLKPLFLPPLKMYYADRQVIIEVDGRVWDRVPDGDFMQLQTMSCTGRGENSPTA